MQYRDSTMNHANNESAAIVSDDQDVVTKPNILAANRPKVLIVDDDVLNLRILSNILGTAQYEMTTATSALEAITTLDEGHYDLIITDVMMPRMSGYEFTRNIRERYSISELPVLLLMARNRTEDIATGFNSGANDYVSKPIDAVELRTRVIALTDLKKSVEERLHMEAAWLQAQIRPHFLFNTLNSIASLSTVDTLKMQDLLKEFSNYLRKSFDFQHSERRVSIDHELSIIRSYLLIEQTRFEERLQVMWEIDTHLQFSLPPLSIQPLVENAVRHGVLSRSSGGTVTIRMKRNVNVVDISIMDDGVGMNEETLHHVLDNQPDKTRGIGLINTDRRLKQMYGKGLQVQSVPGRGTVVTLQIPIKEFKPIRPDISTSHQ